jgi:S-adenosyl methyltransferase
VRHRPAWAPDEIDIERPAAARMYDYYLGGSHNFAADRELAEQTMQVWPDLPHIARANRAYLHRVVSYLIDAGIDQFLDLGSGIPTGGNVHDVSHALNPAARTVYVDADPVAVAHSAALLKDISFATVVHADLRDADAVLNDPALTEFLDLSRPVAVLMFAVLHFVSPKDEPAEIVEAYREATAPGSYLAVSHATNDYEPERTKQAETIYTQASHAMTFRGRGEVAGLMAGYELVPPGLVDLIQWRPDPLDTRPDPLGGDVRRYSVLVAVGRRT